jgi:uncharacterized protein
MQKMCPTDGTPLMEMNKNGVTIDVCPECKGVWLDRGELEKLLQVAVEMEREYGQPASPRVPQYDAPRVPQPQHDRPDPRYAQPDPRYRRDDDDDDDDHRYGKKKKSALGRIFDIFD